MWSEGSLRPLTPIRHPSRTAVPTLPSGALPPAGAGKTAPGAATFGPSALFFFGIFIYCFFFWYMYILFVLPSFDGPLLNCSQRREKPGKTKGHQPSRDHVEKPPSPFHVLFSKTEPSMGCHCVWSAVLLGASGKQQVVCVFCQCQSSQAVRSRHLR